MFNAISNADLWFYRKTQCILYFLRETLCGFVRLSQIQMYFVNLAQNKMYFLWTIRKIAHPSPPPLPQQKKRWFLSKNALLSAIFKHYRPLISVILRGILIYAGILTFHCRVLFWIFWPMISLSLNIFPVFYQKNQKNTYYRQKKPKI